MVNQTVHLSGASCKIILFMLPYVYQMASHLLHIDCKFLREVKFSYELFKNTKSYLINTKELVLSESKFLCLIQQMYY